MLKYVLKYKDLSLTVKKYPVSKRMRLIVHRNGSVTLTCHTRTSKKEIEKFIEINYLWILETVKKNVYLQPVREPFESYDIKDLKKKAALYIPERLGMLARLHNLEYTELSIGSASTKWGSCSRDKRIRISCYVMLLNKEQIDYVLLHELCHLIHFNHSAAFHERLNQMLPGHNEKQLVREIRKISIPRRK